MFENIHWPTMILIAFLVGIGAFIFTSRRTLRKNITFLPEAEFVDGMRKAQLIDLRKKDEFDAGHINGSRNIPLVMLNKSVSKLRGDQPIYLVGNDEKIARRATAILMMKNFTNIYGLQGGINAWSKPLKTKK